MHPFRRATTALALAVTTLIVLPSCSLFRLGGSGGEEEVALAPPVSESEAEAAAAERKAEADLANRAQEPVVRGAVTKIKPFHLKPDKDYSAADPSIPFEAKHYLFGAITSEERLARYGNYYTIFWRAENTAAPVTLLFEYRQRETGSEVHSITVAEEAPRRKNQTKIQITGEEYFSKGSVTSWRLTLTQGGEVIGQDRSFLWQ